MASDGPVLRTASVVVNSAAGLRRSDVFSRIDAAISGAGMAGKIEVVEPSRVAEAVRRLVRGGARAIGVAGGDGTLLTAAEELAGRDAALLPFPTGTLNHFARKLGLEDLASSARALRSGEVHEVALGIVDDRVFLNTATFGFYAGVVRRREKLRPLLRKWPASVVAFAVTLTRLRMLEVTLLVEGERLERRTALVWVGMGWGSFPFVHESPDRRTQPELEIVVLTPSGMWDSLGLIFRLMLKLRRREMPIDDPALEVLHSRHLLIQGQHRVSVTLDGEVLRCEPPILVAIQEGALRVVSGWSAERGENRDHDTAERPSR